MPVLDAAETLGEQLGALAAQDYAGDWEVVIADNGSTDGSVELARRWADRLPGVRVLDACGDGTGPNIARNGGARAARGDFLVFCDADDVVSTSWLSALVAAGRSADIVAGKLEIETLNDRRVLAWNETCSWDKRNPVRDFLHLVSTASCGLWANVFRDLGGFREELTIGEDKDLAWRANLRGHRIADAPDALVAYRYRSSARESARQHYAYGRSNPRLYRLYREAGMPRTRLKDVLAAWTWLIVNVPTLAWSADRRGLWAIQAGQRVGQIVGSLHYRVLYL
jgi:glycosyltransferase involved in cell wall biosynthesis